MPRQYEAIRDSLIAKGASAAAAKQRAARIFNSKRKRGQTIVSPHGHNVRKK